MEKYLYDSKGHAALIRKYEELQEKRDALLRERYAAGSASTRQLADSPELEQNDRELSLVNSEINFYYKLLSNVEIIDTNDAADYYNLNKIIESDLVLSDGTVEDFNYKIVPKLESGRNRNKDYTEVTINSPIGKATLKKQIGDECPYFVGSEKYIIKIKNIYDPKLIQEDSNSRSR